MSTLVATMNKEGGSGPGGVCSAVLSKLGAMMQRISEKLRKFLASIDLNTVTSSHYQERFFRGGCYGRLNF